MLIKNVFLFFRYQVLAGVIEQRLLEPLLHKHKLMLSAISFAVRTGNTFLGSLLWEFITLIWHNPFAKNCSSSLNDSPFSTLPWQVGGLCSMARTTIMLGSKRAAAISYFIVKFGLVLVHYKAIHKLGKLTPVQFTKNLVPTILRSFWIFIHTSQNCSSWADSLYFILFFPLYSNLFL